MWQAYSPKTGDRRDDGENVNVDCRPSVCSVCRFYFLCSSASCFLRHSQTLFGLLLPYMTSSVSKPLRRFASLSKPMSDRKSPSHPKRSIVSIRFVSGSNGKTPDLDDGDKLQVGDIVEQVITADGVSLRSPFAGGKSGLQRELKRLYSAGQNLLTIRVKRGPERFSTARVYIALGDSSFIKRNYVLKSFSDASYIVAFKDAAEDECLAVQEIRHARMVSQLMNTKLAKVDVRYAWAEKMNQLKGSGFPNSPLTMVVLPHKRHRGAQTFCNVEDTVSRARQWLLATQESGVPISSIGMNTESLLIKVSGEKSFTNTVNSKHDFLNVNTGIYGFEDYHGLDIGVVRAVRLWYEPSFAEIDVVIKVGTKETRLGISISRTREGFCYISHVEKRTAADRAGLNDLLVASRSSGKLLVLTRIEEEKILPWLISVNGNIHCSDTMSINQKLSLNRLSGRAIHFRLMATEKVMYSMQSGKSEVTTSEGMMYSMQSTKSEATTCASEVDSV